MSADVGKDHRIHISWKTWKRKVLEEPVPLYIPWIVQVGDYRKECSWLSCLNCYRVFKEKTPTRCLSKYKTELKGILRSGIEFDSK